MDSSNIYDFYDDWNREEVGSEFEEKGNNSLHRRYENLANGGELMTKGALVLFDHTTIEKASNKEEEVSVLLRNR